MNAEIEIKDLTRFEAGEDGTSISPITEDVSGRSIRPTFPTDVRSNLIRTLRQMMTATVQHRRNDQRASLVYPLAESKTELSTDLSTQILTLTIPDGFAVSFAVSDDSSGNSRDPGAQSGEIRSRLAN